MIKGFVSIMIFFFAQVCHAQKKFTTLIRFPSGMDARKVIIEYDDGTTIHPVSTAFNNNKATISGTFYSKYVTLEIRYLKTEMSFHSNEYFLKEGNSSLFFSECRNGDPLAYPFDSCQLSNAIEIRKLPPAQKINLFTAKEQLEVMEYQNKTTENPTDSIYQILYTKYDILAKKQMEFIKQNMEKYFSLWFFSRNFLSLGLLQRNYEALSKVFNSFPAVFKNSFEGKDIVEKMYGAMYTKKGFKAPVFIAKDMSDATINLSKFKGKYVLLTFWASWCKPCLEEMPAIKKIHDTYSTDQLKIISISIDKDSDPFVRAVKANKIDWINILDDKRTIIGKYGGKPIPSIYLINKEGIIVYSNSEEPFEVLTGLLSKSVK